MAKEPDDRYGSTGALGRAAQRALDGGPSALSAANTMEAAGFSTGGRYYTDPGPERPTDLIGRAEPQGGKQKQWVLPTVIAVSAALLLGAIGLVIGLLANQNSDSTAGQSQTTPYTVPAQTQSQFRTPDSPARSANSAPRSAALGAGVTVNGTVAAGAGPVGAGVGSLVTAPVAGVDDRSAKLHPTAIPAITTAMAAARMMPIVKEDGNRARLRG
jgi:hypothetical protein